MKEINSIDHEVKFFGIGGSRMISAGLNAEYHIKDMAFLGFAEVVKHLPFIKKVKRDILNSVNENKIDNIILIDYPGFNLNIAKKLKKMDKKIFYYISPQVWAWGKKRINKIRKIVDKMLVVFPFEKDMYVESSVKAEYVGHPLVEQIDEYNYLEKEDLFAKFNLDSGKDILLVLPGSRKQEVEKIFPETIKAAERLSDEFNLQTVVALSPSFDESYLKGMTGVKNFRIIKDHNYDLFKNAKFGIIKSGTSTLEAGLFKLPHVVVYKTNKLTFWIGRSLIKVKNIALSNIVGKKEIVKELIQDDVNEEKIYTEVKVLLSDEKKLDDIRGGLSELKAKLGKAGASQNAAKIILKEAYGF